MKKVKVFYNGLGEPIRYYDMLSFEQSGTDVSKKKLDVSHIRSRYRTQTRVKKSNASSNNCAASKKISDCGADSCGAECLQLFSEENCLLDAHVENNGSNLRATAQGFTAGPNRDENSIMNLSDTVDLCRQIIEEKYESALLLASSDKPAEGVLFFAALQRHFTRLYGVTSVATNREHLFVQAILFHCPSSPLLRLLSRMITMHDSQLSSNAALPIDLENFFDEIFCWFLCNDEILIRQTTAMDELLVKRVSLLKCYRDIVFNKGRFFPPYLNSQVEELISVFKPASDIDQGILNCDKRYENDAHASRFILELIGSLEPAQTAGIGVEYCGRIDADIVEESQAIVPRSPRIESTTLINMEDVIESIISIIEDFDRHSHLAVLRIFGTTDCESFPKQLLQRLESDSTSLRCTNEKQMLLAADCRPQVHGLLQDLRNLFETFLKHDADRSGFVDCDFFCRICRCGARDLWQRWDSAADSSEERALSAFLSSVSNEQNSKGANISYLQMIAAAHNQITDFSGFSCFADLVGIRNRHSLESETVEGLLTYARLSRFLDKGASFSPARMIRDSLLTDVTHVTSHSQNFSVGDPNLRCNNMPEQAYKKMQAKLKCQKNIIVAKETKSIAPKVALLNGRMNPFKSGSCPLTILDLVEENALHNSGSLDNCVAAKTNYVRESRAENQGTKK